MRTFLLTLILAVSVSAGLASDRGERHSRQPRPGRAGRDRLSRTGWRFRRDGSQDSVDYRRPAAIEAFLGAGGFASVYRDFQDVSEFTEEIQKLSEDIGT